MMDTYGISTWFYLLLPFVAFLYASVGHGGASGYLALMALFSFSPDEMRPLALLLNLLVSAVAFYHYFKRGYFKAGLFWPFALTSIPMAFIGGNLQLESKLYQIILGVLLLIAVMRLLNLFGHEASKLKALVLWQALSIGALIGFASGLIGIGGGIILTPVILLLHWGDMKEAAAVSALFIWVNSASGLLGQFRLGIEFTEAHLFMLTLALVGGFIGAYLGSSRINTSGLKRILAFVLISASIKLFML